MENGAFRSRCDDREFSWGIGSRYRKPPLDGEVHASVSFLNGVCQYLGNLPRLLARPSWLFRRDILGQSFQYILARGYFILMVWLFKWSFLCYLLLLFFFSFRGVDAFVVKFGFGASHWVSSAIISIWPAISRREGVACMEISWWVLELELGKSSLILCSSVNTCWTTVVVFFIRLRISFIMPPPFLVRVQEVTNLSSFSTLDSRVARSRDSPILTVPLTGTELETHDHERSQSALTFSEIFYLSFTALFT